MTKNIFMGLVSAAVAVAALPAHATDWNKQLDLCAAAVEAEGLANVSDYQVKFSGGSAKRFVIKLIPSEGGETLVAECTVSRGQVKTVKLKA